ncbi:DUF222 domain-containing protein [Nocardioides sp. JS614]|uniref:DUF222 domain-containing protein n=2 Tax=unclassified Nocardioides TaxID=2615069 RepID=UPI0000571610|nr:DUF222 domain-containing protein [Nocardioides sp. JS614]ABL81536.1 hypothetical protein Noca_2026 [Nocardioides sp. JS614]
MSTARELADLSEERILDLAGACSETIRDAETELLRLAYQWAIVHPANRLDPVEADQPGRERARQLGGEGTPRVAEFAAAEFGARIGRSPYAAASLIGDALDLEHRFPRLWARVEAGEVRASYARYVTTKTRTLTAEQAAYVDARVFESADGRLPWSRFEELVAGTVAQAAPEAAREKEERAAKARFAKKVRRTVADETHGMASFLVHADLPTIEAIDDYVTQRAKQLADTLPDAPHLATEDDRRVHAFLLLVSGAPADTDLADLLPQVCLYVHTYADPGADRTQSSEGIVRVEGHGPVTQEWVRRFLGPHARFTIRPVLDLAGQAPVDSWEIPDRHRRAVHLMTPADTFPFASCTSPGMQVDHTIPYHQGGVSGVGNYGPMTTLHHRIKTHGAGWQVKQPFPGIYMWRDPHGGFYLVDHTGTRRLPGTRRPLVVELWHPPAGIEIALADDYTPAA